MAARTSGLARVLSVSIGTGERPSLAALLPNGVTVGESDGVSARGALFGLEENVIASAGEKRRREFTAGRLCAREALAKLGFGEVPVGTGANRQPLWPPGVVGSITHCPGYVAAAAAWASDMVALGIDAERHQPLSSGVEQAVCTSGELAWCEARPPSAIHWPTVIFSAKEAIYKCWFPLAGTWLGFHDAELSLSPSNGTFTARILAGGPAALAERQPLEGRFVVARAFVVTAIAVSVHRTSVVTRKPQT